jgi:hypothetical protein
LLLNTIGDERDFKHLLPRLLELFSLAHQTLEFWVAR